MIPPNIIAIGEHEAQLRAQSLEIITADEALLDHLHVIEAAMTAAYDHVINRLDRTPDELTIQKLGIRLFNDLASALSQGLAGYYQQAFDTLRDLVELQFLFDDFSGDRSRIGRWAGMERREREREFSPRAVRERLDERYSHVGQKRRAVYQRFCTLASHPSPEGFRLTAPNGDALIGPFIEPRYVKGLMEEAAVVGLQATINFTSLLPAHTDEDRQAKQAFLHRGGPWLEKYLPAEVEAAFAREEARRREP
jgi:hypothetical protein